MDYSLSDLRAVMGDNNGTFGGGGLLLVVILFLFFVMFRGGWGGNQGDYGQHATAATQQEILYGQHFGQINDRLTNLGNGICGLGYDMQGSIGQLGKDIALGQSGLTQTVMGTGNDLSRQLGDCCCENRLAVANLGAQMDRQTCDITTAIKAEGAATRALLQENAIQALRDQIADLRMDNRMAGVVRYPNGLAYNAGPSPFCGCCGNC
nr:MAG TPA: hypothetical protein [Caudoviricetes sp.]